MNILDLLTPWLTLAAILVPLVYVEKWIHSHLYGVGWLLTNDDKSATALYYVLLFPGVFLHEFTQYLMAGALNVRIKRIIQWPEAQKDGTLRLDFVQIQDARWFQAAIIGATPLITGLALVWVISSQVLSLDQLVAAIQAQDGAGIQAASQDLASTPDFFLWLYLIFTISNAMLPTPADRQGWPLLFGLFAGFIGFLILIGVGDVLYEKFTGPVADAVDGVSTAFAMVLVAEIPAILFIGFFEKVMERITKNSFQYSRGQPEQTALASSSARVPGSNIPLPPGAPLPSIYNLKLPLPDLPKKPRSSASRRRSKAALDRGERTQDRAPAAPLPKTGEEPRQAPAGPTSARPTQATPRRSRSRPTPEPAASHAAASHAQSRRDQPDRARPDRSQLDRTQPDRTRQDRPSARPADRSPDRTSQRPPDERRARPRDQPRSPSPPRDPRRGTDRPGPDRTARPTGPDRSEQERARFARPGAPPPARTPPGDPDDTGYVRDRTARPARPADSADADDRTQRLERTSRLRSPLSQPSVDRRDRPRPDRPSKRDPQDRSRARPTSQRRRSSLFDDEDMGDDDELWYEDDPDVIQDIPDDDLL
jgi:hypothetical protein